MSISKYQTWRRKTTAGGVGCVFARLMAARPNDFGQRYQQLNGKDPAELATKIAVSVEQNVNDAAVNVVTIVLPNVTKLEILVGIAQALGTEPKWTVTTKHVAKARNSACVAFGIVREIPFGTGTCPSEVLILGPFSNFPPTRKASVTAIEVFVGEPMPNDPKSGEPTKKANLAHIDLRLPSASAFSQTWRSSIVGRRKSLGIDVPPDELLPEDQDDHRAKAKVSFTVPMTLAKSLGVLT